MILRIALLALTVAALAFANLRLDATESAERSSSLAVERLVPEEQRASLTVALIGIERGVPTPGVEAERLLYARSKGVWRCESMYRIHCREDLVVEMLDAIGVAEVVPHSASPAHPERYGFDTQRMLTLQLFGPGFTKREDRDLRYTLEVGDSIPGAEGTWVRRPGTEAVLALDRDLRARLAWEGPGSLPPLIDPYVVPATWEQSAEGLLSILVERRDGQSFELAVDFATPAERQAGADPYEWRLRYGLKDVGLHPFLGLGYSLFLARCPWTGIGRPEQLTEFGLDEPRAVITLTPKQGPQLKLRVGAPLESGLVPVLNVELGLVFVVDAPVAELLLPSMDKFETPGAENPWDRYLQAELDVGALSGAGR